MAKTTTVGTKAPAEVPTPAVPAEITHADKKAVLSSEINALAEKYNQAVKLANGKKIQEYEKLIKEKVDEYKSESRLDFAAECRASSDAMATALKLMSYPVIKTSVKEDKDVGLNLMTVDTADQQIDLEWLHKHLKGIGVDHSWVSKVKKLNKCLSEAANVSLGAPIADFNAQYKISDEDDAQEGFSMSGSSVNTIKDPELQSDIKLVVSAMIGEQFTADFAEVIIRDKKKSKELTLGDIVASYILKGHTTRKRGGGIQTARPKTMNEIMATVCAKLMYSDDPAKQFQLLLGSKKKQK